MKRSNDGAIKVNSDDESITSTGSDHKKVAFATNINTQNNRKSKISQYQKLPSQLPYHNNASTAQQYDGHRSTEECAINCVYHLQP